MNRVFIMEKPDMAAGLAQFLWGTAASRYKKKTHFEHNGTVVTWAYGHILAMPKPDAYGEQFKNWSAYPCFPEKWKKQPEPSTKEQLTAIKAIIKGADMVINGGDPDREGQLLIDEILEYLNYKGRVDRILINAKDETSIRRAMDSMCPNSQYHNLYLSGLARQRADWLVGMNLSRAYTVNAQKHNKVPVCRIGRVKLPTLYLVVQREKAIRNFVPLNYYLLNGFFTKDTEFKAVFLPGEDAPVDAEDHLLSRQYLENVMSAVSGGQKAVVVKAEKKEGTESAPLPYSLDTLQVEANRRYGVSPKTVLDTVQSLYEKKLVSYPRSDCNYIPLSQHDDAKKILPMLTQNGMPQAAKADISIKGRAFNSKKVEEAAHHAIIPTGEVPGNIGDLERKIYDMIAWRYVLQFFPACRVMKMEVLLDVGGYTFQAKGKAIIEKGWRAIGGGDDEKKGEEVSLPDLNKGDILPPGRYEIEEKVTTPPARFTEGTLLAAMTHIWKYVSPDNPNREKLKECKGIGTPATRDTIISDLMEHKEGKVTPCMKKEGKELVPTPFGIWLTENVEESLTKPDVTAIMEYNLSLIAQGEKKLEDYMSDIVKMIKDNIQYAEAKEYSYQGEKTRQDVAFKCPVCKKDSIVRRYSKNIKKFFWVCSDEQCHKQVPAYYDDQKGKPQIKVCPKCKMPLKHIYSKKKNKYYWFCEKCNEFKK